MQTKTATAILMLGVGIGLGASWALNGVSPPPPHPAPAATPEPARPQESDVALARERTARIEAETARDALALELARKVVPTVAHVTSAVTTLTPTASVESPSVEKKRQADPARLAALEGLVRDALLEKDHKRALALLREIAPLGRPGWSLATQLIPVLTHSPYEDMRGALEKGDMSGIQEMAKRQRTNPYELMKVMTSDDLAPLYEDAISDPMHYTPEMRQAAATWLPSTDPTLAHDVFARKLMSEPDEVVAAAMIQAFFNDKEPETLAVLITAVRSQQNPAIRLLLTGELTDNPSPESTRALDSIARGDQDEKVRQAAHMALVTRNPPVAGVLITQVVEESQAARAGVREGDIVVSYRGIPTLSLGALQAAKTKAQKGETVLLGVWRDGQLLQLQLLAGQIGVNGHGVRPGNAPAPEEEQDR